MLFGGTQAPIIFKKICHPIVRFFGIVKLPCFNFFDDWFWSMLPELMSINSPVIDRVFTSLGWQLAPLKSQQGPKVKVMGFNLDAASRTYSVPDPKIKRTLALITNLRLKACAAIPVSSEQAATIAGMVLSMSLAVPHVRIWTRAIYACTDPPSTYHLLGPAVVDELNMLEYLIENHNSRPFVSPLHEVEMYCDTGETGWGALVNNNDFSGLLPLRAIAASSTARELTGLLLALSDTSLQKSVRGRVVRISLDSSSAIANLLNGGGPVSSLCDLIKALWHLCNELSVSLHPRWVSRETNLLQHVDALSKRSSMWTLLPSFTLFSDATGTPPWVPDFARVGPAITSIITRNLSTTIIIPRWEACPWWQLVAQHSTAVAQLPPSNELFNQQRGTTPPWPCVAVTFRARW
jgi:hypothetical protein